MIGGREPSYAGPIVGAGPGPHRVAVLVTHPTPYTATFFRLLEGEPDLDVTVLFTSRFGTPLDPRPARNFGQRVVWDTDLFEGYRSKILWGPGRAHPQRRWTVLGLGLVAELRRGSYDAIVIYGWSYPVNWLAFVLARAHDVPFLLYGDTNVRDPGSHLPAPVRLSVIGALARKSAGALYTGTFNRDFYIRHGMPPEKLWFSPYAVDSDHFGSGSRERGRDRLGLSPDVCYFLFVGTLVARKRPLDLLRALGTLQERGHAVGAILVGTGEQEEALRAFAGEHALSHVHFAGFVNQGELPDVYAAADAFVLPSAKDPRATVVNEAMAASRPVVVSTGTGVWGPGDLVADHREGFVFPTSDVPALARACEALTDVETRARMGAAAYSRARDWSFDLAVRGWREAIAAVTDAPVGRRNGPLVTCGDDS